MSIGAKLHGYQLITKLQKLLINHIAGVLVLNYINYEPDSVLWTIVFVRHYNL